jgi:hypothetical protein
MSELTEEEITQIVATCSLIGALSQATKDVQLREMGYYAESADASALRTFIMEVKTRTVEPLIANAGVTAMWPFHDDMLLFISAATHVNNPDSSNDMLRAIAKIGYYLLDAFNAVLRLINPKEQSFNRDEFRAKLIHLFSFPQIQDYQAAKAVVELSVR